MYIPKIFNLRTLHVFKYMQILDSPSICVGTDRPALKYLNKLRADIAKKWHDIGVELLDVKDEQDLDLIRINYRIDVDECTREMLQLWLARKSKASWNRWIEALREPHIQLNALAEKIEKMLCEGIIAYLLHIVCFACMQ